MNYSLIFFHYKVKVKKFFSKIKKPKVNLTP